MWYCNSFSGFISILLHLYFESPQALESFHCPHLLVDKSLACCVSARLLIFISRSLARALEYASDAWQPWGHWLVRFSSELTFSVNSSSCLYVLFLMTLSVAISIAWWQSDRLQMQPWTDMHSARTCETRRDLCLQELPILALIAVAREVTNELCLQLLPLQMRCVDSSGWLGLQRALVFNSNYQPLIQAWPSDHSSLKGSASESHLVPCPPSLSYHVPLMWSE